MAAPNKQVPGPTAGGTAPAKNPKRVAAGRLNRMRREGLTAEGRERLRQTALKNRPWEASTGPRTAEGKARAARNGKKRQLGPRSVREIKRDLAALRGLAREMHEGRRLAEGLASGDP